MTEIRVHFRLYAPFDRILGGTHLTLGVPAGTTGADLLRMLAARYPGFAEHLPPLERDEMLHGNILVARGGEVLLLSDVLEDGELIRIFPALAGG